MSIYPVRIKEWYVEDRAFGTEIDTLKVILKYTVCDKCKKKIRWDRGYVMHAITWGYGEGWCSRKCLRGKNES